MVARNAFHKLARLDRTQSTLASEMLVFERHSGEQAFLKWEAGSSQRYIWSASRQTAQSGRGLHDSGLQSLDFVENDLEAIRAGWGLKATGRLDVGSNAAQ